MSLAVHAVNKGLGNSFLLCMETSGLRGNGCAKTAESFSPEALKAIPNIGETVNDRCDWICSCGDRFRSRDKAWKHPFNHEHVMRERGSVKTTRKDERTSK